MAYKSIEKRREYERLYRARPEVKERRRIHWQKYRRAHDRTQYHKMTRLKLRKQVIDKLGGVCVNCGCSDFEALEINHKYGGGTKESKILKASTFHRTILSGKRTIADLEIDCKVCNAVHYLQDIKHVKSKWIIRYSPQSSCSQS